MKKIWLIGLIYILVLVVVNLTAGDMTDSEKAKLLLVGTRLKVDADTTWYLLTSDSTIAIPTVREIEAILWAVDSLDTIADTVWVRTMQATAGNTVLIDSAVVFVPDSTWKTDGNLVPIPPVPLPAP